MSFGLISASGITNSYNNSESAPKVRVANWVEERALAESTGFSRGNFVLQTKDPNFTASRTVRQSTAVDPVLYQQSATHSELEKTFKSQQSAVPQLARRADIKSRERLELALKTQKALEEKKIEDENREIAAARFGVKLKLNKQKILLNEKILQEIENSNGDPLSERGFNIHDSLSRRTLSEEALTMKSHETLFHKSTRFSKPVEEYTLTKQR